MGHHHRYACDVCVARAKGVVDLGRRGTELVPRWLQDWNEVVPRLIHAGSLCPDKTPGLVARRYQELLATLNE